MLEKSVLAETSCGTFDYRGDSSGGLPFFVVSVSKLIQLLGATHQSQNICYPLAAKGEEHASSVNK